MLKTQKVSHVGSNWKNQVDKNTKIGLITFVIHLAWTRVWFDDDRHLFEELYNFSKLSM